MVATRVAEQQRERERERRAESERQRQTRRGTGGVCASLCLSLPASSLFRALPCARVCLACSLPTSKSWEGTTTAHTCTYACLQRKGSLCFSAPLWSKTCLQCPTMKQCTALFLHKSHTPLHWASIVCSDNIFLQFKHNEILMSRPMSCHQIRLLKCESVANNFKAHVCRSAGLCLLRVFGLSKFRLHPEKPRYDNSELNPV